MTDHSLQVGDYVETVSGLRPGRVVRIGSRVRVKMRDSGDIEEFHPKNLYFMPSADQIRHRSQLVRETWSKAEAARRVVQQSEPIEFLSWDLLRPNVSPIAL